MLDLKVLQLLESGSLLTKVGDFGFIDSETDVDQSKSDPSPDCFGFVLSLLIDQFG